MFSSELEAFGNQSKFESQTYSKQNVGLELLLSQEIFANFLG